MSSLSNTTHAAMDSAAFSLMSRMHVILRRMNERVTDIEYMRVDPTYCRTILNLASALPNEDLREISAKLEELYFGDGGIFMVPRTKPLLERFTSPAAPTRPTIPTLDRKPELVDTSSLPSIDQDSLIDQMYVGRLR
jgi:hypothetical protein